MAKTTLLQKYEQKIQHRAELAVDNFDCGTQLGLTPDQRDVAIQNVAIQMKALLQETLVPLMERLDG